MSESRWASKLLADFPQSPWTAGDKLPQGFSKVGLVTQNVSQGLEVAVVESLKSPTKTEIERICKTRKGSRVAPVLVVAGTAGNTQLSIYCLATGTQFYITNLKVSQVRRVVSTALEKPDHHSATEYLLAKFQNIAGIRNEGLLSTQELESGVPNRPDWDAVTEKASALVKLSGKALLAGLGFDFDYVEERVSILTTSGRRIAVSISLSPQEPYNIKSSQLSIFGASPIAKAMSIADRHNLKWAVLTRGTEIRLYSSDGEIGIGSGSREEKYCELDLALLSDDKAGYLHLLFSAEAMSADGSLTQTVERSKQFAAELAARLRDRVYEKTVPQLAQAVASQIRSIPTKENLDDAYEQVMHILFRLLFVAYGEAKDLLPVHTCKQYKDHSLTRITKRILEDHVKKKKEFGETTTDLWDDTTQLWRAIDKGQQAWDVPAYNGGLFSSDPKISRAGAAIAKMLPLSDSDFGPALQALLIDSSSEGVGPVDFRALSVREFGTIYEGLLESSFSIAPTDLTVDQDSFFVPASLKDNVVAPKGSVYFHNRSGERKATGSYFTKAFAVEHLIQKALVPALELHISRLHELRTIEGDDAAAEAFFDFRCADIAMGSGHFLTAALDKIVEQLSNYLAKHPLPKVLEELNVLRETARKALEPILSEDPISDELLLRRQVARRCIYGIDKHAVGVELAQVAIWIHTFVPGLPLSLLGRNLVCGDSLTGIGGVEEVIEELEPDFSLEKPSLYRAQIEKHISDAKEAWRQRMKTNREATIAEVSEAKQAQDDIANAAKPASKLFDLVSASRAGKVIIEGFDATVVQQVHSEPEVRKAIKKLCPVHFPALFPEVFFRDRPGFDCIVGNPPWEKIKTEKHAWWVQHIPGIKAKSVNEMNQDIDDYIEARPDLDAQYRSAIRETEEYVEVVKRLPFDLGSGDTDLYQAFAWRFWQLTRQEGLIGIILPNSALVGKGSEPWRREIFDSGAFYDVTTLINNTGWVFDEVHLSYSFALCCIGKHTSNVKTLDLSGPFKSKEQYDQRVPLELAVNEFLSWSETAAFPNLPSAESLEVFRKIRAHPPIRSDQIRSDQIRPDQTRPDQTRPILKSNIHDIKSCARYQSFTRQETRNSSSSRHSGIRCHRRPSKVLRHEESKILAGLQGGVV